MTDREIIHGLLVRDNRATDQFFYVKRRPLLTAIMRLVFKYDGSRHPILLILLIM